MASQALVPLIPTTRIHNFIHILLTSKPHNHNEAHGMLLQTLMLLKGHQHGMTASQKSEILDIIPLLQPNLRFIGSHNTQISYDLSSPPSTYTNATPCGALAALALEISILLSFHPPSSSSPFSSSPSHALFPFIEFARLVLQSEGCPRVVLWHSEMLVQAALLLAHAATAQGTEHAGDATDVAAHKGDAADVIARLLRHPTYDVRQVVLKLLSQWRKANSPAASLLHNERVYSTIAELVQSETHPKTLFRAVKLMISVAQSEPLPSPTNIQSSSHAHSPTRLRLWPRVSALLAGHGPLRLCAVQILARLFVDSADLIVLSQPSEYAPIVCAKWADVIDECSTPSSELDLRTTVVESLKATTKYLLSDFSLPRDSLVENCVVRMWIIVIRLLEDDNELIREKAAQLASQTATVNDARGVTQRSALMVSRALECAFAMLTQNFGHSQVYIDFLIGCVDDLAPDSKEKGIGKVSGTRVLFDQEDTNAYVEQLTSTQLAIAQLQKLLRSSPNPSFLQKLTLLLSRMVHRIQLAAQQLSQLREPSPSPPSTSLPPPSSTKQKGSLLLRWITYEKHVFTPLYRAALSLATLSPLLPTSSSLLPPPESSLFPSPTKNTEKEGKERKQEVHPLILHALLEWESVAHQETLSDQFISGLPLFFLTSL